MMQRLKTIGQSLFLGLIALSHCTVSFAAIAGNYPDFNRVASNVGSLNWLATRLLTTGAFGIGVAFTLSALMKYKQYFIQQMTMQVLQGICRYLIF